MRHLHALVGALVLFGVVKVSAAPLVAQVSAEAARVEKVYRTAKAITVRIEGATQGSGLLIARNKDTYTVLTAWHVVKSQQNGEELDIYTPDGLMHSHVKDSVRRIGEYDLATVVFKSQSSYQTGTPETSKTVSREDVLVASGFPLSNAGEIVTNTGTLIAYASMGIDQGYQLLYTNSTRSGMSGGPLLNHNGRVIGIHGRGEKKVRNSRGDIEVVKTGINQGVPIRFYLSTLDGFAPADLSPEPSTSSDYLMLAFDSLWEYGTAQTVERLAKIGLELDKKKTKELQSIGWWLVGTAQAKIGLPAKAISSLNRSINYQPDNFLAWNERGKTYRSMNKRNIAIQDFSRSISINPEYVEAYVHRGLLYAELAQYKLAYGDFSYLIRLESDNPSHVLNRGLASLRLGDYLAACQDIKRADDMGMNYAHAVLLKLRVIPEALPFCS